ncbi:MAG: lipopolysaccharide biosynthesis protein [Bacteroidales bacterium]|nr:lipopolysaccharide biosynthesis protein [Bacteroidales bacterium]
MNKDLGHKAAKGAIWATIDRFGSMTIQFAVNLILARLLLPKDFGIIGMLAVFTAISQTLIDGGFGSALIQKKVPTQTDYSTIFYWNIFFSTILYILLFLFAPLIAEFYKMPLLCNVLRLLALSLILNGALTIQRTRLQKSLAFKSIAIVNISSYLIGATSAVIMAYKGFGVWSLVGMQLIYSGSGIILMWLVTRWKPSFEFSINSIKELFGFGGYIMAANILQTISQNVQGIIIGKRFSATQMGYFSQAYKLDQITSYTIPQVIVQVMYPVYSSIQDDKKRLNEMVLMNMRVITFIVYPILAVLILIAAPLIEFLYGQKWLPSAPYFQVLCVGGFFVCLQNLNFYAIAAVGKSKSLFKWSFYKWGFLLASLIIGMNFGMYGILWGMVISSANIFLTNAFLARKHTGLEVGKQIFSITPIIIIILSSTIISYCIHLFTNNIAIYLFTYLTSYFYLSFISHLKALDDTKNIIFQIISYRR